MYITFGNAAEEDRVTAVGNMRKTGKDWTCCSGDMLADTVRHTDRRTHTRRHDHHNTSLTLTGGGLINKYRMHVTVWVRYSNCFALLIPEGF